MFIYDRFDQLRCSRGITKKFIAQALDRSPALCQDWKQQKSQPSAEQLRKLAELLDTTPAYLCGETDDASPRRSDEADELLSTLHEREDLRMLFKLARDATPEDVRQAVRIIEALRRND